MENCFWPEEYGSWNYTQNESSVAAAMQYQFNHPAVGASPFEGATGDKTASASRSHSEAEKRRRDRINAQLATLRKLIPKSEKMDKAALLGHVVDHVKEQSKIAKEVSKSSTGTLPTETDEVIIDVHLNDGVTPPAQDDQNVVYMRASICCDDRPELFAEINGAVKALGLTIHQADITSVGGRMRSNLVLCAKNNNSKNNGRDLNTCTDSLKQSLKLALSRVVISSGSSNYTARSKRQRFFYPNYR